MRWAYFAMLLAILQTAPPIPRQAPHSTTSTGEKVQKKPKQNQAPPTNSAPSVNATAAPAHQDEGDQQGAKNADNSVVVRELPAVTITTKRDWIDWGIWGFNGLLVIVGFLQWRVLTKQKELMGIHASHLEKLADASGDNAAAAKLSAEGLINIERAWLSIDVDELPESDIVFSRRLRLSITTNEDGSETTNLNFHFNCRNKGRSPAWITAKRVKFEIVDKIPQNPDFTVGRSFQYDLVSISAGQNFPCFVGIECPGRIRDGGLGIIYGIIKYRDIFERQRYTTFGYSFHMPAGVPLLITKYPEYNENH